MKVEFQNETKSEIINLENQIRPITTLQIKKNKTCERDKLLSVFSKRMMKKLFHSASLSPVLLQTSSNKISKLQRTTHWNLHFLITTNGTNQSCPVRFISNFSNTREPQHLKTTHPLQNQPLQNPISLDPHVQDSYTHTSRSNHSLLRLQSGSHQNPQS